MLCNGQKNSTPSASRQKNSDGLKLAKFRKHFWDSLPKPINWTNDFEGLYTDAQEEELNNIIGSFEKETTVQLCIVTIDTMHTTKDQFDKLALHIANTWGVGQKGKNNGVTICISRGYRRIRICNGYGISDILSDSETKKIIDNNFIPGFKEGKYFEGTLDGINALIDILRHKLNPG